MEWMGGASVIMSRNVVQQLRADSALAGSGGRHSLRIEVDAVLTVVEMRAMGSQDWIAKGNGVSLSFCTPLCICTSFAQVQGMGSM